MERPLRTERLSAMLGSGGNLFEGTADHVVRGDVERLLLTLGSAWDTRMAQQPRCEE